MTLVTASRDFSRGYMDDVPRDQLPAGAAYRMKDWLPRLGTRLRRRGAWAYSSPDLNAISAIGGIQVAQWAPFPTDAHLMLIGDNGKVFQDRNFDGVTATYIGSSMSPSAAAPPFWSRDLRGMIQPGLGPFKYTAAAPAYVSYSAAALGGWPGLYASVGAGWGDYVLLANGNPGSIAGPGFNKYNRIWISGVGAPESWTVGTNFWDSVIPFILALVPTRSGILVFGARDISLISGDIPPAGGNWSEQILFHDNGCWGVQSIVNYRDTVIFANSTGVYATDGITLTDVTERSGVKQNWQSLTKNYGTGWSASAGIYRDKYIIRVHDNTNTLVTCHVFDLNLGIAYEFTNFPVGGTFAQITAASEELLFMAGPGSTRAQAVHPIWTTPDASTDANGTDVKPVLETPFYKLGGPGQKVFRSMRATYDMRSQAGSTPSLSVDYCSTPSGAYLNAGSLPTTADESRARVDIRNRGNGIGLRLTQVGRSGRSSLGEIELDQSVLEGMR